MGTAMVPTSTPAMSAAVADFKDPFKWQTVGAPAHAAVFLPRRLCHVIASSSRGCRFFL